MKKKMLFALVLASTLALSGCGAAGHWGDVAGDGMGGSVWYPGTSEGTAGSDSSDDAMGPEGNYVYGSVTEQGFHSTADAPSSYFSLDRNTANYAMVRSQLNAGLKVAYDSVRIEELVNYFTYDGYTMPENGEELAVSGYLSECPWNEEHLLATFGIRTEAREVASNCNNYTFLIDTSGSMSWNMSGFEKTSRLDLVKLGIENLLSGLGDNDRISIVTYASGVKTVLEPTLATESGKIEIMKAVNKLESSGSTNGSGGLQLAYELAEGYYAEDGNNRVILLTDGDFNVGIYRLDQLESFIREKAAGGVYLSVIGVGLGNTRDDIMETLALAGNGNYAYIDSPTEAQKVFTEELAGMLVPVAKDAKAGVTFNPDFVDSYRIIGYDMKTMTEDEFNDSAKDAGEIGSNLCVTMMYELVPTEDAATMSETDLLVTAEVRYKSVSESEENKSVTVEVTGASMSGEDQMFSACVAEFGLILRNSEYKGNASLRSILSRLDVLAEYLARDIYKTEFKTLVEKALLSEKYGE